MEHSGAVNISGDTTSPDVDFADFFLKAGVSDALLNANKLKTEDAAAQVSAVTSHPLPVNLQTNTHAVTSEAVAMVTKCTDTSDAMYHCKICQKGFTSKGGKKFHEKYHHLEAKLFCLKCQKVFKFENDLDRHMKTHSGERPFSCCHCDKTFVCKSSLNQHVRLQHLVGSIYSCSVCAKSFCTLPDLERHYRVHTGNRPFQCDQCSKSFTCRSSLNVHRKTHEGKKFPCSYCNKEFYIRSDLQRHETKHTGNKPWQCEQCSKSYSCKSALKVHQRNMHDIERRGAAKSGEDEPGIMRYSSVARADQTDEEQDKPDTRLDGSDQSQYSDCDSLKVSRAESGDQDRRVLEEDSRAGNQGQEKHLTVVTLTTPQRNRRKSQIVRKIC